MTLKDFLYQLNDLQVLWTAINQKVSVGELKNKVELCREKLPCTNPLRVTLEAEDTVDALSWFIALDGVAESVFLVPLSLQESDDYPALKEKYSSDLYVKGSTVIQVTPFRNKEGGIRLTSFPTRWVLATSGTTGIPKLIEHTTASLTRSCKLNVGKGSGYIWGLIYDPFRFAGLQVVLQSLLSGSELVLCNQLYDISVQAKFLREKGVNSLSATPSYWRKLLMSGVLNSHEFRQITLGGESVDQPILNALQLACPSARIVHIFASTEAGVGFSVSDRLAGFPEEYLKTGVSGNELCIGDAGTLLIKPSNHISTGLSGEIFANNDGFLDTGDLVEVKGNRVRFLGRESGAINVGGNKVIPEEVESIIREVEGVGEVLVKPKNSGVIGQLVSAEVQVVFDGADEQALKRNIQAHCLKHLEKYKVPALIRFVQGMSYNSTGKINRK